MVITRRIPIDENLIERTMQDMKRNRPAGHPTEDEAERMHKEWKSYIGGQIYKRDIIKNAMRRGEFA